MQAVKWRWWVVTPCTVGITAFDKYPSTKVGTVKIFTFSKKTVDEQNSPMVEESQ